MGEPVPSIPETVIDTDTLSAVMRGEPRVDPRQWAYRLVHGRLTISAITRFEIQRGLRAKRALVQLREFELQLTTMEVLPIDDDVLDRASLIWGALRVVGVQIKDADCLIAATAVVHGSTLTTNNTKDFARIAGLALDNWLA